MTTQMLSAVGQQVNANSDLFTKMRAQSQKSLAPATP
jgi:hypothetical protein